MSENRAVFTEYDGKYVLMHIKDSKAEHIYVYDESDDGYDAGTVINCSVQDHVDSIEASFVRYAPKLLGFINRKIKGGEIVPLQYKKYPYGDKKAFFSDRITIDGEYIVATSGTSYVKASSKIPAQEKETLIKEFREYVRDKEIGIIIRTKAYSDEDGMKKAVKELDAIMNILEDIKERSGHTPVYTVLYRPPAEYIKDMFALTNEGIDEIVTDVPEVFYDLMGGHELISGTVNISDRVSLRFYEDEMVKLSSLYGFESKITEALSRTVYLKSGAFITIDITEALTAIDVNSAGFDKKTGREETFLNVNLEAASEIARQIRLRNLSGMIIIDYINMEEEKCYDILEEHIKKEIKSDRVGCRFVDFTPLGLCEMTRERIGTPLSFRLRKNRQG